MALNPADSCGVMDQGIPQWKRELIIRRRVLGRTLQVGSSSVRLTCPAVVAIVRQPEIVDPSENVIVCTQKCSPNSEEIPLSLNQNQLDFHPSTSSAVSVGNMRLLDTCSEVNNLVLNGIDTKNKQLEVVSSDLCVNYNLIMGEDKTLNLKKKPHISRSKFDQNHCSANRQQTLIIDQVSNEVINSGTMKEEDMSDSSEELQYGPGIVNKLKTKYLSMTLREQKRNSRPSLNNLRRATSLENMLDGEEDLNKQDKCTLENNVKTDSVNMKIRNTSMTKSLSHHTLKHLGNRSLETMKRARSMDTLLRSESRVPRVNGSHDFSNSHGKPIENENRVEKSLDNTKCQTYIKDEHGISTKESSKHVKSVHDEMPPPDLVKQTLKIFETSPKKKPKSTSQTNLAKLVAGFSNSASQPAATLNSKTVDKPKSTSVKPIISPKPVLSPEKLKQNKSRVCSPKKSQGVSTSNPINSVRSPTKCTSNTNRQKLGLQLETKESDNSINKPNLYSPTAKGSPIVLIPRSVSPIAAVSTSERIPVISALHTKINPAHNLHTEVIDENGVSQNHDDFEDVDGCGTECAKPVPESALENIRRGGVSVQFSFKNEKTQNCPISKSYLPKQKSTPQAVNSSVLRQTPLDKPPPAPLRTPSSPQIKQIGIIRPLVSTKVQRSNPSTPVLTEQELEKNLINRVKSIDQPISKVVVAIKALPDSVVLGSVSSDVVTNKNLSLSHVCTKTKNQGLWDEKIWNQNTIVFNFSDRKEIPDYIENDGLILRGKRERPRPGEPGVILLNDSVEAEADESSTDPEELDPPSPCDVTFEGDNVLINGKSNLKKSPRQVKLRIKFNDEATTMFEYPSEASLVEDHFSGSACGSATAGSDTADCAEASVSALSPHSTSLPTTGLPAPIGGSLGAYTPRQLGSGGWQLGLAPVQPPAPALAQHSTVPDPEEDDPHLKPAPPEATTAWSEETASDLLF